MLQKDPEKRSPLIDIMNEKYFMIDDQDLEELIKVAESRVEEQKVEEEKEAEKKWEKEIMQGLHLNQTASESSSKPAGKQPAGKTPGSKGAVGTKTPGVAKVGSTHGQSSFSSSS